MIIEVLKARFTRLMSQEAQQYLGLAHGKTRDKAVEAVLEYFLERRSPPYVLRILP
jgi:hypothetical protein